MGSLTRGIGGPLGPLGFVIGGRFRPLGAILPVIGPPIYTLIKALELVLLIEFHFKLKRMSSFLLF
jgi:hypothetical protein